MPKSGQKMRQTLTIHPVFVPSRLARTCLEEAYAYLIPKGSRPRPPVVRVMSGDERQRVTSKEVPPHE